MRTNVTRWVPAVVVALTLTSQMRAWADDPPSDEESSLWALTLNDVAVTVYWNDGDSFTFRGNSDEVSIPLASAEGSGASAVSGADLEGQGVRLMGFNTLESYGPVHQWGEWTAEALYGLAGEATELARSGEWHCTATGATDHYGRLLVHCDDLILSMVGAGLAHIYCLDEACPQAHIDAQQEALAAQRGMWAGGDPVGIITSVHSMSEYADQPDRENTYNRVIATSDGQDSRYVHTETYAPCQWFCLRTESCDDVDEGVACAVAPDAQGNACMLYVPYQSRYGEGRAACLQ